MGIYGKVSYSHFNVLIIFCYFLRDQRQHILGKLVYCVESRRSHDNLSDRLHLFGFVPGIPDTLSEYLRHYSNQPQSRNKKKLPFALEILFPHFPETGKIQRRIQFRHFSFLFPELA
ncbi:hypothetical protein CDAR_501331 [Caerostris darwini]|uniref:Maturase K n=1 Tax=Caerostris darwini TaxID=1538125 RepID=A0AAV4R1T7_9ARAC|nr:hypothetical protein CDAR_501331 [Caerostris darwini]